jgi:hypothetical protein
VHSQVTNQLKGAKLELRELKARSLLLGTCTSYPLLRSDLEVCAVEIKDLKHQIVHSSRYSVLSFMCDVCGFLKGKVFHVTKENTELKQEVAYLTSCFVRMVLSEKMIEEELSRVEESATKFTYKLGVGFERCENKGGKSAHIIPTSNYHKDEETIKSTKAHNPSNPKSSFNPKREVRKETPKSREEAFVYMFCGRAGHLDEFCFWRRIIEKRRFEYARNSHRDEFFDFSPHSCSCASRHISSRALSHFPHGPNHRSYDFGSQENRFVPRRFGYGPCPHRDDLFPRRHGFLAEGSHSHLEPRHLDGPRFSRHGSRPTRPNGEVQRTVKTSLGRMIKCWIHKIYLTNPSTEPSTSSHTM